MKIQLIYPHFLEKRIHGEEVAAMPMGLFSVAAVLAEAGHRVSLHNWHQGPPDRPTLRRQLLSDRPDLVGFSILHANRWGAIDTARTIREMNPGIPIVFGGVGATFLWRHLLTHFPQIDYVVVGEGERSFPALAEVLASGRPDAAAAIDGLAFRRGDTPVFTGPADPVADLDTLPDPSRYFTYPHVSLTRGCPSACRFCGSPRLWGRRVRSHSAEYFVGQLHRLHDKGARFFYVSDDTFTLNKKRVIEICRKIIEKQMAVSWNAISRIDAVDEEVLSWMRRAGCIQISYGIESGSEAVRENLGKRLDEEKIEKAFALTAGYGILPRAYFIYGCPGDSDQTMDQTLALMERIRPLAAIFYILDIFPGTALYDDYLTRTGADDDIWLQRIEDLLYLETDPALSRETVLGWGKRLRDTFHRRLPAYARSVELVDDPAFAPLHADFLSRLALTFDQGDYARIAGMPDREETAEALYRRALSYAPEARAYLGLGMMQQRRREVAASLETLGRGLKDFPGHEQISICLAVSLMNAGDVSAALEHLAPFDRNPQALSFMAACHRARGDEAAARACEARGKALGGVV